ncbi:MAG: response regulator [Pseudomonadota bacterium]
MRIEDARILVVEDNETLRSMLGRSLTSLGAASFELVADAEQAQALLSAGTEFDILLSDIRLPGMDGAHLARWVQAECPQVHIILQTAYSNYDELPFRLLKKPYGLEELRRAIESV